MPSLKSLLTDTEITKNTSTGVVARKVGVSFYIVNVGGAEVSARSMVFKELVDGEHVVVTKTGDAWYIIGSESVKNRNLQTVVVDG